MEDIQIFSEVPDELYNAGWRVHHDLEDDNQYFVKEEERMLSDTLPTVVKSPSTTLTLFDKATIDVTKVFVPSFYTEAKGRKETRSSICTVTERLRKSP